MKTQLQEAGLDAENMVTTTSTLRDKLYGLTEGKVDIMVDDKTLKSTAQILRELSTAYNQLDDDSKKAAILELVAGKVQANVLASLLQNFDLAEKAMETSANSAGSALAENTKFLDSIVGKTQQFTNATENLWNNLISSDSIKKIIDMGTRLVDKLDDITSKLGIFGTAIIPIAFSAVAKFFGGFNLGIGEAALGLDRFHNATYAVSGGLLSMIGYFAKTHTTLGELKGQIAQTSVAAQGLAAILTSLKAISPGGWIAIGAAAIAAITAAIISFKSISYDEHVERLEESYKELTLIQQNIKDLNAEIETTKDRIEELQKLVKDGTISPIEKDELDELIRYNTELERQTNIQKAAEKYQQKKTAQEFLGSYEASGSLQKGYDKVTNTSGSIVNPDDMNLIQKYIGAPFLSWVQGNGTQKSDTSWFEDELKEYEQAQKALNNAENELTFARKHEGTYLEEFYGPIDKLEKKVEKAKDKVERIDDALYEASQGWKTLLENQEYYYAEGDEELEEWQKESNRAYKAISAAQDKYLYSTAESPAEKAMYRQQMLNRIFMTQATDEAKRVKEIVDNGGSRDAVIKAMQDMDHSEFQYFGFTSAGEIADYLIGMAEAASRAKEEAQELAEDLKRIAALPSSIDNLTASFESYSKALDIVNALSSNNITLTEDQYKTLNEYLGSEEEFAEAIDTSNGNLVKNRDVLVKLLDTKKKETQENLKLSRAQAKVTYAKLNNELKKIVTSTKNYNTSTKNSVKSLKDQIDSVKNVIKQYDRLEDQLLGTYSAFDKFEDAKTADAATDYTSKVVEMLEAVDEGFKTAKVGSETFMSAMEGLVPPTIGINFEDPTDKIQAMYDYIYNTVAKYATIDEDDGITITMPNVKAFVEDAISAGVFSGSWENFDLIDGKTIDDLVSGLNISEPLAYALLEGLSDYVIGGESILAQFDTSIEGRYTQIINKFANVNEQYINSLDQLANAGIDLDNDKYQNAYNQYKKDLAHGLVPEDTGTLAEINQLAEELNISAENYLEIFASKAQAEKEYINVESSFNDIYNEAINTAKDYLNTELKLAEAQEQYNDLYEDYQRRVKEDGTQYSRTELQKLQDQLTSAYNTVDELQTKLGTFEQNNVVSTLAIEGIDQRIDDLHNLIDVLELKKKQMEEEGISSAEVERSIHEAEDQIAELNDTKIELNANYIQSNKTVIDSLEKIQEFKIGDKEFSLTIKNAATVFNQLKKFVEQQMKLDGATVHMSVQYDGSAVKVKQEEKEPLVVPTIRGPHSNTFNYSIEPKAIGQNNSLVGELGQELVVDPDKGKFFTVGDHGAEFTDIPDNAIVFNHKQTKDLLTHGHTTRGRALANGNQTFSNYYTPPKSDDDDDDDSSTNEFEQTIDFIEYKFEELSQTIEQLNAKLENTVDLSEKNQLIDDIIKNYRQQLQDIPAAITVYSQKAAEELAKIPFEYRDKAMNGAFEIKDFVGDGYEGIVEAIENYREFANKVDELNVSLEETRIHISESAVQKLENIQAKYEADSMTISASIEKLESQISYLETTGEDVRVEFYKQIIPYQEQELELLRQEREELEKELVAAVNRGDILTGSQTYIDQLQKINDQESAINEKFNEIAATNQKISQTNFDNTTRAYENKMRTAEITLNRLQNQVNLVEEQGDYVSSRFYEDMIGINQEELDVLQEKKQALKEVLDQEIAAGRIVIGSEPYYEMVDAIYDVDEALDDTVLSIEQFQNSINDLHWQNFDKLLNRLGYIDSEISHVYDLMSNQKLVDDFGEWTDEGITALAMQAQAMEAAGYKSQQYADQIQELRRTQSNYSDEEYEAKLNELIEGQWDSIDAYESAKDAIVSLNRTRVDAVKDGIQKEIDAYQELINLKKEELNANKELHDFEKNINSQAKTIADLEKQIAARAGSTDAATIAERKRLEAELLDAREALNETYYDTAVSMQQEALDDELNAYNKSRNDEVEALEKSLDEVETIVADTLSTIRANTSVVIGQLENITGQYGIELSDTLTSPWERGAYSIDTYTGKFLDAGSIFTDELNRIKSHWEDLQEQADRTARAMAESINTDVNSAITHPEPVKKSTSSSSTPSSQVTQDTEKTYLNYEEFFGVPESESRPEPKNSSTSSTGKPSVGSLITVKQSATNWGANNNYASMAGWVKGSQFYIRRVDGDEYLISPYATGENYTGWVKLKDIQGYARGSNRINNNQWAWIDEIGEEIVMRAGANGRLSYLTKGSSVLPSDVSANLLKLGQADPRDILERSRPKVTATGLADNGINVDMSFGSLLHVDSVSEDTLPKLKTLIRDEFDVLMKNVNTGLKKYVR